MKPELELKRQTLEELVYGGTETRRFTQDSPILPDVWIKFGEDAHQSVDLLLIPDRSVNAGAIAADIHERLKSFRGEVRAHARCPDDRRKRREPARIAHLPGVVAVRLYFDELLRLVLPATVWWKRQISELRDRLSKTSPYSRFPMPSKNLIEALAKDMYQVERPLTGEGLSSPVGPPTRLPPDVAWTARLAGTVAMTFQGKKPPKLEDGVFLPQPHDHQDIAEAFLGMYNGITTPMPPAHRAIHRVSLNRDAVGAVERSALACKADAARLLFNVSCRNIVWAIADSGIESRHPAFHNWRGNKCESRVIKTYDFRTLRESLSLDREKDDNKKLRKRILDGLKAEEPMFDDPDISKKDKDKREQVLNREAGRKVEDLFKRLKMSYDVDWALLEPLVQVDQHSEMRAPVVDHGTHVAGIVAADWPTEKEIDRFEWPDQCHPKKKPTEIHPLSPTTPRRMIGMCPDIKLIDLRVLRDDGKSDEFEVIAALQLVRFLNTRAGHIAVHGVNLSLSIEHDVANYACGRTPICDECDQLVAAGVVVVAAAGNRGHQRYMVEGNRVSAGYSSISITDPGNAAGVITVGATHRNRPHEYGVSYFSSRGPTGDGRRKPDLVAPGEKITAPVGRDGQYHKDGTSMAAPHVSGAVAMLMARHSELIGQPRRIKEILCETATDLGREPYFQGAGMLDILRALQSV